MKFSLKKFKSLGRFSAIGLAVLILLSSGAVSSRAEPAAQTAEDSDGYSLVTQSEGVSLYAAQDTGDFYLSDKLGRRWYSSPTDISEDPFSRASYKTQLRSLFYITYADLEEVASNGRKHTATSYEAIQNGGAQTEITENGVRVTVDFSDLGITVPVAYSLENGHLNFSVDAANIKEGKRYLLLSVDVLPAFAAADWNESGYMLVPDGSGALINYNNKTTESYDEYVYGDELSVEKETFSTVKENIHLPVFGSSGGKSPFFAVITDGAAAASVTAASGNDERGYNTVSSRLNLRILTAKVMFSKSWTRQSAYRTSKRDSELKNYTVRYYPLSGEKTDYTEMASVYRKYLTEEKGLTRQTSEPVFNFDLLGAIDVKANFLGFTYYKPYALTTYKEALKITDELKKLGIENMSVRYLGWGNDGLQNNKLPKSAKAMSVLGGKKDLKNMIKSLNEDNIKLYLDTDFLSFDKGTKNASKTVYNEVAYQDDYMYSVYASRLDTTEKRLVIPSKASNYSERYLKSFLKYGCNISLSSLTNTVYSDFGQKNNCTRYRVPGLFSEILKQYSESKISVAGESANDYALPYLEKILSVPVSCSGFRAENEEVPFYQLCLRGYIPISVPTQERSDNPVKNYLKAVQTGCELLWTGIYEDAEILSDTAQDSYFSTTYSYWAEDAVEKYADYMPLLKKIGDSTVSEFEYVTEYVSKTVFENGITVYVNFGETDYTDENGKTVSANGFVYY